MTRTRGLLYTLLGIGLCAGSASAATITFDIDDGGGALVNGQLVDAPNAFGDAFTISSTGTNLGAVIFDSSPAGPNAGGSDSDLLVDRTNILILQNPDFFTLSSPGIFDVPNDHDKAGTIAFDFSPADFPVLAQSIDVIDIDEVKGMSITLVDTGGRARVITLPSAYTGDINFGDPGLATIDFAAGPQESPNLPGVFSVVDTDAGFDLSDVASITIAFEGSGAIDNLTFVPEPATALLLALGAFSWSRRRNKLGRHR